MSDYRTSNGPATDRGRTGSGSADRVYPHGPGHGHRQVVHKHSFEDWWDEQFLAVKILLGFCFAILGAGIIAFFGWITMILWNWIMPEVFGLTRITYWQAWGILLLSTILFKRIGGGEHSTPSDRKRKRQLKRYLAEEPGGPCGTGFEPDADSASDSESSPGAESGSDE